MCLHIFLLLFPFLWAAFFFFPVVFKFDQKRKKKKKKEGKERTNIRTQAGRNKWEKKAVEKRENEERMQCMWKIGHCLFAQYCFNWNICILGLWKERTWFHMHDVKLCVQGKDYLDFSFSPSYFQLVMKDFIWNYRNNGCYWLSGWTLQRPHQYFKHFISRVCD